MRVYHTQIHASEAGRQAPASSALGSSGPWCLVSLSRARCLSLHLSIFLSATGGHASNRASDNRGSPCPGGVERGCLGFRERLGARGVACTDYSSDVGGDNRMAIRDHGRTLDDGRLGQALHRFSRLGLDQTRAHKASGVESCTGSDACYVHSPGAGPAEAFAVSS